jgi:hypothetical protein
MSVGSHKDKQPFDSAVYVSLMVFPTYTTAVVLGIVALLVGS